MARTKRLDPIPPGEILAEEFMKPNGISQTRLARDIDVNPARVNDIVHGRSSITADRFLGKWMNHAGSVLIKDRRGLIVSFDPFECDIAGEPREVGDSIVF